MNISIVIPNWNGQTHLATCLDSIASQTLAPVETILVDNGSTDDSRQFVGIHYPWVKVIPLNRNTGFAFAVNRGIEAASGQSIALLNNDVELGPAFLAILTRALSADPQVGSATGKMLNFFNRTMIDGAGDGLTFSGMPFTRGYGKTDDGSYDSGTYVFGACAGASLYRRAVFDEVGMFDEDFVSYYEDVDLAYRMQMAGYKTLYVPEAVCYHKRNATGKLTSDYPLRMQGRNVPAYVAKNFPWQLLLTKLPLVLLSRVKWLLRSFLGGSGLAALKGTLDGFALLPAMIRKRSGIQSTRRVSIRYLNSFMRGDTR